MVWHDDKGIKKEGRETVRQVSPRFGQDETEFSMVKQGLALPGANGYKIGTWLAVVISPQTSRATMMFFWIVSHRFPLRLDFAHYHSTSIYLMSFFGQKWLVDSAGCHQIPTESCCHQDKHKAPTRPHILPLSLQKRGERFPVIAAFGRQISCRAYACSTLYFAPARDSSLFMTLRWLTR